MSLDLNIAGIEPGQQPGQFIAAQVTAPFAFGVSSDMPAWVGMLRA